MRCPLCDASMREVERRGVRIDVCPECRGVWLDRGELEKLLTAEREKGWADGGERDRHDEATGRPSGEGHRGHRPADEREHYADDERRYGEGYRRKKKGWLSEIFDFDFLD